MIVETLFEKGSGLMNEDFYIVSGNLFGVFDGATSLSSEVYENRRTGGFLASHIAGEIFRRNDGTLKNLAEEANAAIAKAMRENGMSMADKRYLWNTGAAVVRVDTETFEWIQIGDCLVLVFYDDGRYDVLTDNFDHDFETLQLWKETCRQTMEPIQRALKDQIQRVREQMNVSYGSFSGEKEALSFIQTGVGRLEGVKDIVLFTDGLFIPRSEPSDRSDFDLFSTLYRQGGLYHVGKYVREMESTDEACRIYPRFKTHDDIAAISLTF